ncbi:Geraniol dehydrogenase [Madurella mycetomatis]|uniref:Geraniol dehydrogenase n=1 Tax=Madurella mycetomatis TaxID=100816 RepID=A0A175W6U4_9PEZI|nr:Geraniol dehydrogenase [Madurella mycetomatis]
MSPPRPSSGFTSEAYIAPSPTSPITFASIRYGPIRPDEIVLDTAAFSVCATDVKVASGAFAYCKPPLILGHECAGTVVEVGVDVADLRVGDKVVLSYASCGGCEMCVAGENAYCYELVRLNFEGRVVGTVVDGDCARGAADGGGDGNGGGGLSEGEGNCAVGEQKLAGIKGLFFGQSCMGRRIVARACSAVKLSPETSEQQMCLYAALGCGIQTGVGAILNVAKPDSSSAVCIFGAGSVGLAACLAARLSLPAKLVLVDKSPEKLAMLPACVKAAATDLVDSSGFATGREGEERLVKRLKDLTAGGRGFDYVLDCVGRGDLVKIGHLALRAKGTIITVGGSPDMALQVTSSQHLVRGITYRGTHQGDSVPRVSIPFMIDLWKQGKFPFDELLTFYSFDELDIALRDLRAGCVIKPVVLSNRKSPAISDSV